MKYRARIAPAALLFSSLLAAGCGGGGGGGALPNVPAAPMPASAGGAAIALVIPLVPSVSAGARKKPGFVSPATMGATIAASTATGVSASAVDLSPQSNVCAAQNTVRVCNVVVQVPYGRVTFAVTTYDTAPVNNAIPRGAHELGTGSVTQTIVAGGAPVAIAIDALVNGYGSLPAFASLPADGATHAFGFALNPTDFGNAPIANGPSDPYANPIAVTLAESGGSGHAHLVLDGTAAGTSATLASAQDSIAVAYDGGGAPGYAISVTFSAASVSPALTAISPLYVTSTSPSYAHGTLALSGTSSNVSFTISEQHASGVTYATQATNCATIASATQPSTINGVTWFTVSGGATTSTSGCRIAVSDGMSSLAIAVANTIPATATPSPSAAPSAMPTSTPTATPTASPTATPTASPTATPLVTPPPLGPSIYVSNGFVWNSFPLAAAQAAGGTYNAAPATTISFPNTYTSYFAVDQPHNLIWLSGAKSYPLSWNGAAPNPLATLVGGGSGGVGVDASGNVYQNESSFPNAAIGIYPYGSTTQGTTLQLPTNASALAMQFDTSGNIYVSDNSNNMIYVIANPGPNAGTVVANVTRTISGPFNRNWGLCLDSTGRIYVVDTNGPSGTVDIFAAGTTNAASGTAIETISGSAFGGTPEFCDVDPSGNLWVTDLYDVQEFTAAQITANLGGTITTSSNKISGSLTTLSSATGISIR